MIIPYFLLFNSYHNFITCNGPFAAVPFLHRIPLFWLNFTLGPFFFKFLLAYGMTISFFDRTMGGRKCCYYWQITVSLVSFFCILLSKWDNQNLVQLFKENHHLVLKWLLKWSVELSQQHILRRNDNFQRPPFAPQFAPVRNTDYCLIIVYSQNTV